MTVVPFDGRFDDACVGGVDVVLVEGYGVEERVFRLDGPAPEGGRVDLAYGGQCAVRSGVDVRLNFGETSLFYQRKLLKG